MMLLLEGGLTWTLHFSSFLSKRFSMVASMGHAAISFFTGI